MKTLRTLINSAIAGTGTAFAGLVLATGLTVLPGQSAHAQSARCPAGFTASFNNNALTCSKTETQYADAICPPPSHPANIEKVPKQGRDRCKVPLTPIPPNPNSLPSVVCAAVPTPGPAWTIQNDVAGFNDRCTRQITTRACPTCS